MRIDSMDYLCCPACNGELRLTIEKQTESEVVQGILDCLGCERRFGIKDGLPNLIFPETLEESDFKNLIYHDKHPEYDPREWLFCLGIWEFALWETRARQKLINKLELKKNASVLETGAGNGSNLPIIADQIGKDGRLDGMDVSYRSLKVARIEMKTKGIQVELIQGNASCLPYRTAKFDAVLHVGALNNFGDKKRAIEEMHRVAKPGSKIVICDEGLDPSRHKTFFGRWILKRDPASFANKPPVELVPIGVENLKVYWVWQRTFWVIEFRKEL